MKLREFLALHTRVCNDASILVQRKNHDYAGGDDLVDMLAQVKACAAFGADPAQGVLVRMSDKLGRLFTARKVANLKVRDERVVDTVVDLINYSVFFLALLTEESDAEQLQDTGPR